MNWMQVEAYLAADDRCVLPIGSTEQHAQLSLCVDAILAERVAVEAAEPLGVPVYPAMPFGLAPLFPRLPGHDLAAGRDAARGRARSRRLRSPGRLPPGADRQWARRQHAGRRAGAGAHGRAPEPVAQVPQLVERAEDLGQGPGDRPVRHARELDGELPLDAARRRGGAGGREAGAGSRADARLFAGRRPHDPRRRLFGGEYQKPDEIMLALWRAGVEEIREALEGPWPSRS